MSRRFISEVEIKIQLDVNPVQSSCLGRAPAEFKLKSSSHGKLPSFLWVVHKQIDSYTPLFLTTGHMNMYGHENNILCHSFIYSRPIFLFPCDHGSNCLQFVLHLLEICWCDSSLYIYFLP